MNAFSAAAVLLAQTATAAGPAAAAPVAAEW